MEWMFAKMLLSLGLVLALMFGLTYLLRRYVVAGGTAASQPLPIELLGRKTLQPKKSVVVIKVADKVLVLGVSEQSMQLLTELTEEELRGSVTSKATPVPHRHPGGFAAQLQAKLNSVVNRTAEKGA